MTTHVADVIIHQDPEGSPSLEQFQPGQARMRHLKASIEILEAILGKSAVCAEVPALPLDYVETDIDTAILVDTLNEDTVSVLYDAVLSSGAEAYLPILEEIRV